MNPEHHFPCKSVAPLGQPGVEPPEGGSKTLFYYIRRQIGNPVGITPFIIIP